ncbi:MAG: phospho-sugar mutase [Clostridia bacterium]|nr:phospho-sugar mutase [Clostridia bacterium]
MYKLVYNEWLEYKGLSAEESKELSSISGNEKEIEYRFGKDLEFGTAGMRGIIGLGTNMMNVYTVRRATQGLAKYIIDLGEKEKKRGVVISYDTRKYSYEFAYATAVTLVSNGVKAYLFKNVHPVPMLSFAVRKLKTIAGIMITASHNPKEYNGYKVYGEDGAQMSPDAMAKVVEYINDIESPLSDKIIYDEEKANKIIMVGKGVDRSYYKQISKLSLSQEEIKQVGKTIKLVYTPVHGSGYIPVTTVLKKMGINPFIVPEQTVYSSEFPTVKLPNPEFKETLDLGIKLAEIKKADIVFGTDPDCDRLGVAIRNDKGDFISLSGNQVGILLLDYVLRRLSELGKLDKNSFVVKSFVTTSMAIKIAESYGVEIFEVPVGFKFIGEKIRELDDTNKKKFLFGFEESCGYLRGTHARDKDAVVASMLFAEMACYYQVKNVNIYDRLNELYKKFGFVFDKTESVEYTGVDAMDKMNEIVAGLKKISIKEVGNIGIKATRDYSTLTRTEGKEKTEIKCTKCNAIYYELVDGGFICVRPSGTEPKLKIYYSIPETTEKKAKALFEKVKEDFEKHIK